jgi:preprotein translocase subunit SecA
VRELGGLYVIGTERHQSRRIDRQLRGRCSRQGDPGMTKFYLSLEDELLRLFLQGNLASKIMEGSMKDGEELEHPWLNRSIESAQKKVEQQNFAIRKRLLQYDDVLNKQREVIYGIRNAAIHAERPRDLIFEQITEELINRLENVGIADKAGAHATALESFVGWVNGAFPISLKAADLTGSDPEVLAKAIVEKIASAYAVKESVEIPEALGALERYVVIHAIDHHWQEHLTEMENLRQAVGLRSYGQTDPLVAYKSEAFTYFNELMANVRLQICTGLFRNASNLSVFENMLALLSRTARAVGPTDEPPEAAASAARLRPPPASGSGGAALPLPTEPTEPAPEKEITLPMPKPVPTVRAVAKVGRNDPCPCGSGKKYKSCHGA